MLKFEKNFNLKNYNSFGIDVNTKAFVQINNEKELIELTKSPFIESNKILILSGGSNILFTKDFEGLVIYNNIKGMRIIKSEEDYVVLSVSSGENWSDFVNISLKNKYYGLENLAMIPGKVGSAPVQNIGAYGVEQKDFFLKLKAFNFKEFTFKEFDYDSCKFDYRNSFFKESNDCQYFITEVIYKLSKKPVLNLTYKELKQEIDKFPMVEPDSQYIYETVCRLRRNKLPDPLLIGNAGSFFKNPIIEEKQLKDLLKDYPDIKHFSYKDNLVKVSAGWLIEKCGYKGFRVGDAGVFEKHALILVNYGKATGKEIMELAELIENEVYKTFKIKLEKEVKVY
ncbi:MAG: UDP-N-acetylmuramate dehydrogenase [Candidatus Woesearchaeota archaeon]